MRYFVIFILALCMFGCGILSSYSDEEILDLQNKTTDIAVNVADTALSVAPIPDIVKAPVRDIIEQIVIYGVGAFFILLGGKRGLKKIKDSPEGKYFA